MLVSLPTEITEIFAAVEKLELKFPGRKFTPDGHLVGSIGEVIAKEAFDLELLPASAKAHDAIDPSGRYVQIKLTGAKSISLNENCDRLLVFKFHSKTHAALVYDGDGDPVWKAAGKMQKNGQCRISFAKLKTLRGWVNQ